MTREFGGNSGTVPKLRQSKVLDVKIRVTVHGGTEIHGNTGNRRELEIRAASVDWKGA